MTVLYTRFRHDDVFLQEHWGGWPTLSIFLDTTTTEGAPSLRSSQGGAPRTHKFRAVESNSGVTIHSSRKNEAVG
jgi:hypothetical protein